MDDSVIQKRREECERKARRGEMDPRLEFTFQLLIDGTGLPRHAIMDHVFEGNMLDDINQLFLPHMRNKLLWYYQDVEEIEQRPVPENTKSRQQGKQPPPQVTWKRKLFLSDGWDVKFTGVCIYMFRINVSKQLPEEGFHKDLFCGILNAEKVGMVTAIERVMEHVYMSALAHPSSDGDEDETRFPIVKNQLLPGLRSFCSALKVCEDVCNQVNLFEDGLALMAPIQDHTQLKDMAKNPNTITMLEERVTEWIKKVMEILSESEQLRREVDSSGPQDELEYWKKRGAQFSQLVSYLQENEVQLTLSCLQLANSKVIKQWRDTDHKITFCYNEAKDNAKFVQAMEKCCHSLYLDDPVKIKDSILSLLQTVRLIHSVSQFYNTSERISSLMVKITNQMIETCKQYITCRFKDTIWSQERSLVRDKLIHCINLNRTYRETYIFVKNQPFLPNTEQFSFSENYVFGKFDTFCKRLNKIIAMFDLTDDYNYLFEKRMEGLLLGEDLEEAVHTFEEAKKAVTTCQYDYLDYRNNEFDKDYHAFEDKINALKESIGCTIEENFSSVWETPQGIKFLTRFEKVSQKIQITKLSEKYDRVLKYSEKEVDKIMKMFKRQKDDPPLPRNYSPVAGRIKWSRCLMQNMIEIVESVCAHPVLRGLPASADMMRKYTNTRTLMNNYEDMMKAVWMNQNLWDVDESLNNSLLKIDETGCVAVNLDKNIKLLIRESDCLVKMGVPLPIVCHSLYAKKYYFTLVNDSLQFLLEDYLRTVRRVKLEVRPLFLPQVVRLSSLLLPGLRSVCWTSEGWKEFIDRANAAIKSFDVLVTRVHDIYTNRIIYMLSGMQEVTLITLPEETPWSVQEFVEKVESGCRNACVELNRKSLMVEEAVEEVLDLVKKAAQQIRPTEINPDFEFLIAEDDPQSSGAASSTNESTSSGQQDWSAVWECFESPHRLLSTPAGGLSKSMQEMVKNAVNEMRRYYSRKVVDVLIRVKRRTLDVIIKQFSSDALATDDGAQKKPIFLLHTALMIPNVSVAPTLDEIQEVLVLAGKHISGLSKGVAQWSGGKTSRV
uniref:Dynein heavy chain tail domain-containing protein n=1 Tax=Bombyx mori TaxID=7091 RepID=A0A8R2QY46_BOMMO|nr:dynein heavy chain 5, axonemal isoform X1 [Bombyx mori]